MKLIVTLVEGDPQTKKPAVQMHHFVFLCARQEGWKQQLLLWVMALFKNYVRNVRNLEKMIAHGPPPSLLQDKT